MEGGLILRTFAKKPCGFLHKTALDTWEGMANKRRTLKSSPNNAQAAIRWVFVSKCPKEKDQVIVSLTTDPQSRPQYTIILIMGTPNYIPLISGIP